MELKEYKKMIAKAQTKEELKQISYKALLEDNSESCLFKSGSLYNKVVCLCISRELQLEK